MLIYTSLEQKGVELDNDCMCNLGDFRCSSMFRSEFVTIGCLVWSVVRLFLKYFKIITHQGVCVVYVKLYAPGARTGGDG
jgi:hypothetical protein